MVESETTKEIFGTSKDKEDSNCNTGGSTNERDSSLGAKPGGNGVRLTNRFLFC